MKRIFLLIVLAFCAITMSKQAHAQAPAGKRLLNIAFEAGFPTGNASDFYNVVLGGSLQAEFPITKQFTVTGTTGYSAFTGGKDVGGTKFESSGFIPLKGGVKYYFKPNFYALADLGAAFGTREDAKTSFVFDAGLGYSFPVANNKFIDVSARFEDHSREGGNWDYFGLRFAYAFGF